MHEDLYKTGDKGETRLLGGKHVSKADPRGRSLTGAVDETEF